MDKIKMIQFDSNILIISFFIKLFGMREIAACSIPYQASKAYFSCLEIWQPCFCNLATDSFIVKLDIFELIRTRNVLTYERYFYCLQ